MKVLVNAGGLMWQMVAGLDLKLRSGKKFWHDLRLPHADLILMWKSHPESLYCVLQSHQLLILSPLSYSFKLKLFFCESHNISVLILLLGNQESNYVINQKYLILPFSSYTIIFNFSFPLSKMSLHCLLAVFLLSVRFFPLSPPTALTLLKLRT